MLFHVAASCVSPQNEHARAPLDGRFLGKHNLCFVGRPFLRNFNQPICAEELANGTLLQMKLQAFCPQMLTDQLMQRRVEQPTVSLLLKAKISGRGVSSCARSQNNLTGIDEIEKLAQVDRERIRLTGEGFADPKGLNQSRAPHFQRCTCIRNRRRTNADSIFQQDFCSDDQRGTGVRKAAFMQHLGKTLTFAEALNRDEIKQLIAVRCAVTQEEREMRGNRLRVELKSLQKVPVDITLLDRKDETAQVAGMTAAGQLTGDEGASAGRILCGAGEVRLAARLRDAVSDKTDYRLKFSNFLLACGGQDRNRR